MNKADIARHVYERSPGLSKTQAQAAMDVVLDAIGLGLLLGGDVRIAENLQKTYRISGRS